MLLISLQICLLAYLLVPGLTCSEDIGSVCTRDHIVCCKYKGGKTLFLLERNL